MLPLFGGDFNNQGEWILMQFCSVSHSHRRFSAVFAVLKEVERPFKRRDSSSLFTAVWSGCTTA